MTAIFCLSSLCWAGTSASIASLILCSLSERLDRANRQALSHALLCAATFFGGCSWVLLTLTTITLLRNL